MSEEKYDMPAQNEDLEFYGYDEDGIPEFGWVCF